MSRSLGWYANRLRRMSAAEIGHRCADGIRHRAWAGRQVPRGEVVPLPAGLRAARGFSTCLPEQARLGVAEDARAAVIAAAERLLAGQWSSLGVDRPDIVQPDWFLDPASGRRAPDETYAFRIDHRDEAVTGNVKNVWELSRHHHLTVLAAAYWLTGEERYAELVASQLTSWWRDNPFLTGVHWTSGIELGIRLISWAWVRRLLDDWPKISDLFEGNEDALRQIWWHQVYLSAFQSRGSSANNHVVAEAAGRLVAACAFPWYAESERWRARAASLFEAELAANTFESGINKELATDYHRFVTELALVAAVEADAARHPLSGESWAILAASADAAASLLDATCRPPRQNDADEGRGLVVDAVDTDSWAVLLSESAGAVGAMPWWPRVTSTVAGALLAAMVGTHHQESRPRSARSCFPDAGLYLLRTPAEDGPEIWCRCDSGPHGFLSIAAHAHADALSVEVRYDGVDVLADPGTYCYHGEPEWRHYFRSTLAHNTIELAGQDQSISGGPFLWTRHAHTALDELESQGVHVRTWGAHHDGYQRLDGQARHARTVTLDAQSRHLSIVDSVTAGETTTLRMTLHLGPTVDVTLNGTVAELRWPGRSGAASADLHLPGQLSWEAHRGETEPPLGWYSPRFGERVASTTLVGSGVVDTQIELRTLIVFPSI